MSENKTITIEMPAPEFFKLVHCGMDSQVLYLQHTMKGRRVEDIVIADGGRYRVVYGAPAADEDNKND